MDGQFEKMPDHPESYWLDSTDSPTFPSLDKDVQTEVVIVGGGITGITAAYLLLKEGLKVVLIEAGRIFTGTTGHTTAKITAQHGLIYDELIGNFGEDKARLYYQANMEAADFMSRTVKELGIDCQFKQDDAYVYTNSQDYVKDLEKEAAAYEKLGIDGGYVNEIPLDIPAIGAVVMRGQYQFHPLHYLKALTEEIVKMGGAIYEETFATTMEEGETVTVSTKNGPTVKGSYVISASHFPFHDGQAYFARLYPERSYAIAAKASSPYQGGMYINAEQPSRSIRSVQIKGEEYLILGGDGHKTGQGEPEIKHYEALEKFANDKFQTTEIAYRWSAQDYYSPDKVPYIGTISNKHPNVFVATGYRKWGMAHSAVAAMLIRDLIKNRDNRFIDLYTPSRFKADPSIKKVVKENMNVAKELIGGKLDRPDKELKDIGPDEGAPVTIKGKRAGAYKTEAGELFVVDTTCTHMGCEVNWNSGERTWDCPCHGSRFTYSGEVLAGPAEEPLKRINPDEIDYSTST